MIQQNDIILAQFLYGKQPTELMIKNKSFFKFSSDWDELMQVIEKIESFKGNKDVIHWSRNNWTIFDLKLTESKIQTVYNSCIEFVKWYNENFAKRN